MDPVGQMDTIVATAPALDTVEAVYRQEADRLWRALVGFSADENVASDAVLRQRIERLPRFRHLEGFTQ